MAVVDDLGSDSTTPTAALEARLLTALRSSGLVTEDGLNRALQLGRAESDPLWSVLPRLGLITEDKLTRAMADAFSMALVDADDFPDEPLFATEISARFLSDHQAVPVARRDGTMIVAVRDPDCGFVCDALAQATGTPVAPVLARPADIAVALERLYPDGRSAIAKLASSQSEQPTALTADDLDLLRDSASEAPVIRMVNLLIENAILAGASDIHIEPFETELCVRYRIDGVLHKVESPPIHMGAAVISRVKLMSNLNIAERRLPQDGRAKLAVRGNPVDMRVSTMPMLHGESVVLRILDRSNVELNLTSLGFADQDVAQVQALIHRPSGIILVVGPTGSGKTTTLYAALSMIDTDDRKALTVEDPVEYQFKGIVQTQIRPDIGLDFANVLRSALRQDPDVIMVGEIRDRETAEIAVQASLTGHTVFSTLHTNSAVATVTRLIDMGVEPYLIGATLGGVVAQRLVRRLCPECRQQTEISPQALRRSRVSPEMIGQPLNVWAPTGCPQCNDTGYAGRTVIYEILHIDEPMRHALSNFRSEDELRDIARNAGVRSLFDCGLAKAVSGATSLEEVLRVTMDF